MSKPISWSDRFALIEHFKPTDAQVCAAFGLTSDEYATAQQLRAAGTFRASTTLDVTKYMAVFSSAGSVPSATGVAASSFNKSSKISGSTTFTRPETAVKKPKVPQKRGRKGDKIQMALADVPETQMPVEAFMAKHGISLAVLRQSKRFLQKLDTATAAEIGRINVRQDKTTKTLMIWREKIST